MVVYMQAWFGTISFRQYLSQITVQCVTVKIGSNREYVRQVLDVRWPNTVQHKNCLAYGEVTLRRTSSMRNNLTL